MLPVGIVSPQIACRNPAKHPVRAVEGQELHVGHFKGLTPAKGVHDLLDVGVDGDLCASMGVRRVSLAWSGMTLVPA